MIKQYRTILIDPPWPMKMAGRYKGRHERARDLPYPTMTMDQIASLPVFDLAEQGAHLWLWVTNQFLEESFSLIRQWGFKYLAPVTWAKPSGFGNYFVHLTEHLLFAYKGKCQFNKARYVPNYYEDLEPLEEVEPIDQRYQWGRPKAGFHSRKPEASYALIESVSDEPRLEMFARPLTPLFQKRPDWDVWGNEVESDLELTA
jgi:N6-adenosine-specific RNA methylase IME4